MKEIKMLLNSDQLHAIMQSGSDSVVSTILSGVVLGKDHRYADDGVWWGRHLGFTNALTQVLVFLRDKGELDLTPSIYFKYLSFDELENLVFGEYQKIEGFDVASEGLKHYFSTLPGWEVSKIGVQSEKTVELHGYISMYLDKALRDL